ncbi:MAG TPA: ABC transporter permease [Acidimicrobiales bacterium]|nr:ABC transporter permease [Acidimicrobiales bacterium]
MTAALGQDGPPFVRDGAPLVLAPLRRQRSVLVHRALRSPALIIGCAITLGLVLVAVLAPLISPYPPDHQDLYNILSRFSSKHLLGTDELGRDELSRLIWAARTDLQVGVLAVIFPFCFGTVIGTLAGYRGGWLDTVVMRAVDVLIAFPFYVLVIGLIFVVGTGTTGIYVAFAVVDWVVYARAVRSTTLVVRESDYVAAARTGGLPDWRILWRHVLPNTVTQAVVYLTNDVVLVIVAVVTLGYLGLGVQPPAPDWGTMISEGQEFLTTYWALATLPGVAVLITGLGLSMLGDGLADVLRPR